MVARLILAAFFIGAGANHFLSPALYVSIVPRFLPSPRELVLLSGVAEICGGLGVLPRRTRVAAGWGLIALLGAVFPANVQGALSGMNFAGRAIPAWLLWLRLPLQLLLIAWVYRVCVRRAAPAITSTETRA